MALGNSLRYFPDKLSDIFNRIVLDFYAHWARAYFETFIFGDKSKILQLDEGAPLSHFPIPKR